MEILSVSIPKEALIIVGGLYALIILALSINFYVWEREDESAVSYEVDTPRECRKGFKLDSEALGNPSITVPGSTAIQCYNPATGQSLGRVNPNTADGIDRAIQKAAAAQEKWAKSTFAQRRKVLRTLWRYIIKHQDEIVKAACIDSGKTRVDASFGEVLVTAEKLSWTIKNLEKALRPDRRGTNLLMCYKRNEVWYEPLGVVAACVSWNYPFHNAISPLISTLATGNALILKSSEQTAFSTSFFTSIARSALSSCGHSPHLLQNITCWPGTADHLTSHPSISHITFIGSRTVGQKVALSAANSLTPTIMELGGKDAAIVLDDLVSSDGELDRVASILMRGVFQASGQNCIGIERVIALPKVHDHLLKRILPRVRALRIGNPLDDEAEAELASEGTQLDSNIDIGACISSANFARLESLISSAVAEGASLLHGGTRYVHPRYPKGSYFTPTLLADVTPSMAIAQTELFAPIFLLMRARNAHDAVRIANSAPEYSLGCSVFGRDDGVMREVAKGVKAGMVSINDFASYYLCSLPFGGVGGSGYGRFGGVEGLRGLCNLKSVNHDRWWGVIKTQIPPRLNYVRDVEVKREEGEKRKAWEFVKGIVGLGYGGGVLEQVRSLFKIIGNG